MGGDRDARARELFLAALDRPPEKRRSFLQEACESDEDLRREVESLLAHHDERGSSSLIEAPTTVRPTKPAPPRNVGPYWLLQKLGEGGMGEVYEAEQEKPVKRRVAIKLVKWGMSSEEVLARFESERQALALMSHPNIARVYDAGATEDGRPYFAMEHVAGIPITAYCDTHRLSVEERLGLFIQVCHGVQHAHQKGVIHRDIKPPNILVAIEDGRPVPKIIDFGVAKATSMRLTERTLFTQLGQWIGTPEYMSPEQAEMTGLDIDTRTDVYSLGVVLYELLVGARPFDPRELREVGFDEMRRTIREKEPARPSTRVSGMGGAARTAASSRSTNLPALARGLRGDLDWVTMKALEKDRTRRYGSPAELAADLERHLRDEPIVASPPSTAYRVRKFVRRHRLGVAASAAVIAALLIAIAGTSIGLLQARREAARARQVSEFLVRMFEDLHPDAGLGPTLSVRDMLDRGASRLDRDLADQPLERARLMAAIGSVYTQIGGYDEARLLLEGSLAMRSALPGDDHPDVAVSTHSLGWLQYWSGDYPGARVPGARPGDTRGRLWPGPPAGGIQPHQPRLRALEEWRVRSGPIPPRACRGHPRENAGTEQLERLSPAVLPGDRASRHGGVREGPLGPGEIPDDPRAILRPGQSLGGLGASRGRSRPPADRRPRDRQTVLRAVAGSPGEGPGTGPPLRGLPGHEAGDRPLPGGRLRGRAATLRTFTGHP